MFLQLDGTFWIQLINFAIFFAIVERGVSCVRSAARSANAASTSTAFTADYDRYQAEAQALRAQAEGRAARGAA